MRSFPANKTYYYFIDFLKVIAIILITNSHFKPIYGDTFSVFAFGGAMGCAIFFFCSGFTLYGSDSVSFIRYFGRRVIRIYPAYYLMLLAYFVFDYTDLSLIDIIFPSQFYWFLQAIIVFYVLYYFTLKFAKEHLDKVMVFLFILMIAVYSVIEHREWDIDYALSPSHIHWIFYFAIMIFGGTCRKKVYANNKKNVNGYVLLLLSFVLFLVAYSLKFLVSKYISLLHIQLLFPLIISFTVYLLYEGGKKVIKDDSKLGGVFLP